MERGLKAVLHGWADHFLVLRHFSSVCDCVGADYDR
jgi:hypothetical protein